MKKIFTLTLLLAVLVFTGASCISFKSSTETGPMGVFRSADKGDSWISVAAYPTAQGVKSLTGVKVYRLFEDPSDANAFYLASRGSGLFYTYNNGGSWQAAEFFAGKFIYALAVDPSDKCTVYASDGPHIYKTDDCSRTWRQVFFEERPNERFVALSIDPYSESVWGAELGGDVLVSRDGGGSWTVIKRFDFQLQDLVADINTGGRLYVASTKNGLYRSDDNGMSWKDLREGMKEFNDSRTFYRLYLNPAQKDGLFWISKYGILRSDNMGESWSELKLLTPPGSVAIYGFAVNPKNQNEIYYTGTILSDDNTHVRSTFYKTVDGGNTWVTKKLPTNTMPVAIQVHDENPEILFMGFALLK